MWGNAAATNTGNYVGVTLIISHNQNTFSLTIKPEQYCNTQPSSPYVYIRYLLLWGDQRALTLEGWCPDRRRECPDILTGWSPLITRQETWANPPSSRTSAPTGKGWGLGVLNRQINRRRFLIIRVSANNLLLPLFLYSLPSRIKHSQRTDIQPIFSW